VYRILYYLSSVYDNVNELNECVSQSTNQVAIVREPVKEKKICQKFRTDFGELQQNLSGMEAECKNSLGYLKLSSRQV
jgi:hypothetical protein